MRDSARWFSYLAAALIALSASAEPVPSQALSMAGRWYSYFGVLEIEQNGDEIEAAYSCCRGKIRGRLDGRRAEFTWKDEVYGEGWGYFRLEGNGNRLEGEWGYLDDIDASGEWGSVRMDDPEPGEGGRLARYRVAHDHPRFGPLRDGEVVLGLDGSIVDGRLRGHYMTEFQDKPYRVDVYLYLDGRLENGGYELEWEDPRYGHFGPIRLDPEKPDEEGHDTLDGEWEPFGAAGTSSAIRFEELE